jgi:hypothetical protein
VPGESGEPGPFDAKPPAIFLVLRHSREQQQNVDFEARGLFKMLVPAGPDAPGAGHAEGSEEGGSAGEGTSEEDTDDEEEDEDGEEQENEDVEEREEDGGGHRQVEQQELSYATVCAPLEGISHSIKVGYTLFWTVEELPCSDVHFINHVTCIAFHGNVWSW